MRDPDKLHRSNMILIGLVVLFLLYGIIYRVQTGDTTMHLFGFTFDLPFVTQQESTEQEPAAGTQEDTQTQTSQEEAPSESK